MEKILPAEPDLYYPLCLAGKRSGLPEDCGGSWGYAELLKILKILKILKSPHHPDHQEMKQSAGERFEPETVDLEEINQRLRRLRV